LRAKAFPPPGAPLTDVEAISIEKNMTERTELFMSSLVIVDSSMIDSLRRKARTARLQACRASPMVEVHLKSLADLYEADAERLQRAASGSPME
jgi:hypothetical protein